MDERGIRRSVIAAHNPATVKVLNAINLLEEALRRFDLNES